MSFTDVFLFSNVSCDWKSYGPLTVVWFSWKSWEEWINRDRSILYESLLVVASEKISFSICSRSMVNRCCNTVSSGFQWWFTTWHAREIDLPGNTHTTPYRSKAIFRNSKHLIYVAQNFVPKWSDFHRMDENLRTKRIDVVSIQR